MSLSPKFSDPSGKSRRGWEYSSCSSTALSTDEMEFVEAAWSNEVLDPSTSEGRREEKKDVASVTHREGHVETLSGLFRLFDALQIPMPSGMKAFVIDAFECTFHQQLAFAQFVQLLEKVKTLYLAWRAAVTIACQAESNLSVEQIDDLLEAYNVACGGDNDCAQGRRSLRDYLKIANSFGLRASIDGESVRCLPVRKLSGENLESEPGEEKSPLLDECEAPALSFDEFAQFFLQDGVSLVGDVAIVPAFFSTSKPSKSRDHRAGCTQLASVASSAHDLPLRFDSTPHTESRSAKRHWGTALSTISAASALSHPRTTTLTPRRASDCERKALLRDSDEEWKSCDARSSSPTISSHPALQNPLYLHYRSRFSKKVVQFR